MTQKEIHFSVEVYKDVEELTTEDAALLTAARKVTEHAYAPYSNFLVGAVASLANGETISGTNQENASYPVGICAERVLLSCIASQYPGVAVNAIAISYDNPKGESDHPISPCGICRQTLAEYEERVKQPIRLIMSGMKGEVFIVEKARQLLPLSFSASDLV
ncbi:MAG: cytidine deaminase [Ferruginibacter sp.]|nr:cytidine deaminase [Ferruginibacter sp.]